MNKLFVFLTFFIITSILSLDPKSIGELKSQKSDVSNKYCEKNIEEGIKLIYGLIKE